jgi:hypothetical protein
MNTTKWNEVRLGMYELKPHPPRWRTKDVQNGYVSQWDGEWFHHFRGYETIEWADIRPNRAEDTEAVLNVLHRVHVAGEKIGDFFRVYGYIESGKTIAYF